MKYVRDEARDKKMLRQLGKSQAIVDRDFLPKYVNRIRNYPQEYEMSYEVAKTKRDPKRYFAVMWAVKNIEKTVKWMKQLLCRLTAKKCDEIADQKIEKAERQLRGAYDPDGRARYEAMTNGLLSRL